MGRQAHHAPGGQQVGGLGLEPGQVEALDLGVGARAELLQEVLRERFGVPTELKTAPALLILILVLLVRPQGILGRAQRVG